MSKGHGQILLPEGKTLDVTITSIASYTAPELAVRKDATELREALWPSFFPPSWGPDKWQARISDRGKQ